TRQGPRPPRHRRLLGAAPAGAGHLGGGEGRARGVGNPVTVTQSDPNGSAQVQVVADLSRLVELLVDLTGLPSRWNGEVLLRDLTFSYAGQKHQWCGIS